jgi:predicted TIM-barrel fold metal-dependent hydrolase
MPLCPKNHDLDQWLDMVIEDPVDPERPVVDPHHHLWDPLKETRGDTSLIASLTKNWSRGWKERLIYLAFPYTGLEVFGFHNMITDKYCVEDLRADFGGHNVQQSIVIESQFEDKKVRHCGVEIL